MEKSKYGELTITDEFGHFVKKIDLVNFAKFNFKDNRLVSVCETEEETFVVSVENPKSSGRTNQTMHLSKESLMGLLTSLGMYFEMKGISMKDEMPEFVKGDFIDYEITPELKKFDPK